MANTEDLTALRRSVDGLSAQLKDSREDREGLHGAIKIRTRIIIGFAILFAVVSGFGIWLGLTATSASNDAKAASAKVASVAHADYETCLSSNQFRADTRQLWGAVITTLQPLTTTAQGRAFVAEIQHDVDLTTTPRVCKVA